VNIGDKIPALRRPLLGSRKDPVDEERLLKLYWNRAELKRELARLDEQLYQLRERLKQQEAGTARVEERLEALGALLGNPELGFGALVHFQLRALWRACQQQLDQFGTELKRQQEDRERKRQLVEFHQDRQLRLKQVDERLQNADAELAEKSLARAEIERQLSIRKQFWHYFKRRALRADLERARAQQGQAENVLEDMRESRRTIEKEPWPEFAGVALEGRRTINLAIIAYAQLLVARLADAGLATPAKSARQKSEQEVRYGSREECMAQMADIGEALKAVREARDLAVEIKSRTELLRSRVQYAHEGDTVPDPSSLPANTPGRAVAIREPNVLLEDYWDVYTVLAR
jgi:hypothetical protein